jgi:hypothetical protein
MNRQSLSPHLFKSLIISLMLLLALSSSQTYAQVIRPKRHFRLAPPAKNDAPQATINAVPDTVLDLGPYLASKANCDFVTTIDTGGCVIVKYADGFTKKICHKVVTEVITADGHHYVSRHKKNTVIFLAIMQLTPPNPNTTDVYYNWLKNYAASLLVDIKELLNKDPNSSINSYLAIEHENCGDNIYKQIEYRTSTLETVFLPK